jgi:DNA-directed RNA polymerase subunit omega
MELRHPFYPLFLGGLFSYFEEWFMPLTCNGRVTPWVSVKDEYLRLAQERIEDPRVLVNLISKRVRQLRFGAKAMVETLERLDPEDIVLREIAAGKLLYELPSETAPLEVESVDGVV